MSSRELTLDVRHVSKRYCRDLKRSMWYGVRDLCTEIMGGNHEGHHKLRPGEFFALRDISFRVEPGECVALLGPNGGGKSTMMKLISGLLKPNAGEIRIRGKVGALIELGTGFNPLLSGRDNVYINGAVLGMTRREIDERFDEILDFSELGEFIEAPVKTYSSGMRVRLGFSVAAHLRPQLLLLDEILAVGDLGFRLKCFAHLSRLCLQGTSIILVSHSLGALARIARRCIVFGGGRKVFDGDLEPGIAIYEQWVGADKNSRPNQALPDRKSPATITSVRTLDGAGRTTNEFQTDEPFLVEVAIQSETVITEARICVQFLSTVVGNVASMSSAHQQFQLDLTGYQQTVRFEVPRLPLLKGAFELKISLYGKGNAGFLDEKVGVGRFRVVGPRLGKPGFGLRGVVQFPHRWTLVGPEKVFPEDFSKRLDRGDEAA